MQSIPVLTLTILASAVVSAERFVNALGAVCGLGEAAHGVARSDAAIGDAFSADVLGTAVVTSGAAFPNGTIVMSDALGRAVPWVFGYEPTGQARAEATAAGQSIEILLLPKAAQACAPSVGFLHTASGGVTANRFVTLLGALAGAGAATAGVSTQAVDSGHGFNCIAFGYGHVLSGDAFSAGDTLMSDATSRAIAWTANNAKAALALDAATAAGQLVRVLVLPNTLPATALSALTISVTAGAGGLTAKRYVKADGTIAGAGDNAIGVAVTSAAQGAQAIVAIAGLAQVTASDAVSVGAVLKSATGGKAVTYSVSGAKVSIARTAAAQADDDIWALLASNV